MRHAVLSGGLGELVLVGEIDLVLLLLAAGLFDGGAEAAEQHVAADFILSSVGFVKIDDFDREFRVGKIQRFAHEYRDVVDIRMLQQLLGQWFAGCAGCADNQGFHVVPFCFPRLG